MEYFKIKNWLEYQHYKNRRPPWIKIHNSLQEDYEFLCLPDASKLHLISIWLLASRSSKINGGGEPLLPADEKYLTSRAGLKAPIRLKPLVDKGFLIPESETLATCLQDACLETEAYKQEAYKQESELFDNFWDLYDKKVGKQKSLRRFRVIKDKSDLMKATQHYLDSDRVLNGYKRDPERFLRN